MNGRAFYNEHDPFAAQWLRELVAAGHVAPGDVDERDISDILPDELDGYTQCHFFAGIGGWSLALRLAGWPDDRPVWTGSCPCQPFSSAARGRVRRTEDPRHLWPHWASLIASRRPDVVFGEQVPQATDWLDGVWADIEAMGYTFGAAVLPAYLVGQDHVRERIYFAGYAHGYSKSGLPVHAEVEGVPWGCREPRGVVPSNGVPDRMAQLRAFGNAIVPQVAAAFIEASGALP